MGCCCDKSAMPIMGDAAGDLPSPRDNRNQARRSVHDTAAAPFDFVFHGNENERVANTSFALGSTASRRQIADALASTANGRRRKGASPDLAGTMNMATFTPRDIPDDLDSTSSAISMNSASRQGGIPFMTNAHNDINRDLVGSFIGTLQQDDVDPVALINLMGSSQNPAASAGGGSTRRPSRPQALSQQQKSYICGGIDWKERTHRFMEVEELARGEVYGAMLVTAKMIELGLRQMLPTIRQRCTSLSAPPKSISKPPAKSTSAKSAEKQPDTSNLAKECSLTRKNPKCAKRLPVLVIHSKDILVQMDTVEDVDCGNCTGEAVFSDREATAVHTDGMDYSTKSRDRRGSAVSPSSGCGRYVDPCAAVGPCQQQPAGPHTVEHYEILGFSGHSIRTKDAVEGKIITETWDFLSQPDAQSHLNHGNAYFRFVSGNLKALTHQDREFVKLFVNISGFSDETKENFTPHVDTNNIEEQAKYVAILVKAMYILPGAKVANMDQDLIASLDYNRNCQPGDVKFEEKNIPPRTFREVKTIIKFIYSITIQMFVTEITDPEVLYSLKEFDGMVPTKAILLERTKRDPSKVDSTAKCKSLLMYYAVNGGVLVSHSTIVLNTSVPTVASKVLNMFGGQGSGEAAQTAEKTRKYLINRFGDSRLE